jgi:hypothetical protein
MYCHGSMGCIDGFSLMDDLLSLNLDLYYLIYDYFFARTIVYEYCNMIRLIRE